MFMYIFIIWIYSFVFCVFVCRTFFLSLCVFWVNSILNVVRWSASTAAAALALYLCISCVCVFSSLNVVHTHELLSLPFNVCKLIFVMYGKVAKKKIITMATFAHSFSRNGWRDCWTVVCVCVSLFVSYALFQLR